MNIWLLCLGQAAVALLLFFVLCGVAVIHKQAEKANKRLEKTQLAVQELCDRIWDRWQDE
ncbi:MAG: hypothetical protein AMJ81_00190 [Phycisphaerae bacterium SM23_33]|nr:MAG: hypothetical protein AMJ81_00190 [Phycisphaerae bacterium SM23_33]